MQGYNNIRVKVQLNQPNEGLAFRYLLNNFDSGAKLSNLYSSISAINPLGSGPDGNYSIDFYSRDKLSIFKSTVDKFMNDFINQVTNENLQFELFDILQMESKEDEDDLEIPGVLGYEVVSVLSGRSTKQTWNPSTKLFNP
ncbi:hypothetical protein P4679_27115 [Priestia megaterium]|uniref:hypothetical protein n=1 Tax=Priestia megaterium TaxID=1404 RepID=UPI002E23CD95|nr:hypothetical protein [Priestia megaterium]